MSEAKKQSSARLVRWGVAMGCVTMVTVAGVACSPPQVNLQRADLNKITTTGFRVVMNLSIFNPNAYSIPLDSVGWDLALFRKPFTKGTASTRNQIGASSTAAVEVPLGVRFSSVSWGVQQFMTGQDIPWGLGGQCNFSTPAGPINVGFSKDGVWKNPLKGQTGIRLGAVEREQRHEGMHEQTRHAEVGVSAPQVAAHAP